MWQWLCFEQYNLEPNVATVRFWLHSLHKTEAELGEKLTDKRRLGFAALDVLERGLAGRDYLVANRYTLADIGLYAYTHVAEEGGFPLERYPAIRGLVRAHRRASRIPANHREIAVAAPGTGTSMDHAHGSTIRSSAAYQVMLVALLSLNFGIVFFDRNALNFLMPFVQPDLGLSNTQVGMLASALSLTWSCRRVRHRPSVRRAPAAARSC